MVQQWWYFIRFPFFEIQRVSAVNAYEGGEQEQKRKRERKRELNKCHMHIKVNVVCLITSQWALTRTITKERMKHRRTDVCLCVCWAPGSMPFYDENVLLHRSIVLFWIRSQEVVCGIRNSYIRIICINHTHIHNAKPKIEKPWCTGELLLLFLFIRNNISITIESFHFYRHQTMLCYCCCCMSSAMGLGPWEKGVTRELRDPEHRKKKERENSRKRTNINCAVFFIFMYWGKKMEQKK